jgi:cell division protein FtsW (lipid II flippase)
VQGSSAVSRPDSAVPSPKPEKENQAPSGREIQTGFYTPNQLFQAVISWFFGAICIFFFFLFLLPYRTGNNFTLLHFYITLFCLLLTRSIKKKLHGYTVLYCTGAKV